MRACAGGADRRGHLLLLFAGFVTAIAQPLAEQTTG